MMVRNTSTAAPHIEHWTAGIREEPAGQEKENPFSLAGETALITGGGTGLGLGIARCFARAGARVAIVGRRIDVLKQAVEHIGKETVWESHDILQLDQAGELIDRLSRRIGPISILVNNAGIHIKKPAVELTPEEFGSILQTHLVGAFSLTRAVLPEMIERRHGSILFNASMASLIGLPLVCAYSAAKAGYIGLVRSLATEVSPHGVRVNAIAPGWIDSEMMRSALNGDPERRRKVLARTPMNRFGDLPVQNSFTNFCARAQDRKSLRGKRLASSSPVRWVLNEPNRLLTLESAG